MVSEKVNTRSQFLGILNGKGEIIFDQLGQMAKEDLVNAIEGALQQQ
ncbi:MAG: hypothetical protein IMZ63_02460 [Actinobacteria bacterium]|nr:hypothetical protein [Actinomycetota bacterium]